MRPIIVLFSVFLEAQNSLHESLKDEAQKHEMNSQRLNIIGILCSTHNWNLHKLKNHLNKTKHVESASPADSFIYGN